MKTVLAYVVEEIQHRRDEQKVAWEQGDSDTWNAKQEVIDELYAIKKNIEKRLEELGDA